MKQLLQFVQNHWVLCAAFITVLLLLIFEELKDKLSRIQKIDTQQAILLINRENAVILDLRNQTTFSTGHILGSTNISRTDFDANIKKLESHKNKPLILVDENDSYATSIGIKLKKHGFTKVSILTNGIVAWKNAQLPLKKDQ